nr:serine hydroxymethyltransferase [Pseudomonas sp.]
MTAATSPKLFPGFFTDGVAQTDPELAQAIQSEFARQQGEIELIASENIVSQA